MRDTHETDMRSFEGRTVRGTYRLRKYLGEGGFGGVFLSDQYVLGEPIRRVALKLSMRTRVSDDDARDVLTDAFLLAEAMDSIVDTHARAHLVHVYDAGIAKDLDGRWFLTMEYVAGPTLADQFASLGKVPAPLLIKWVTQMCTALRGLHTLDRPLLHRDLKPSNVLLDNNNAVRLVDFGLAAKMLSLGPVPGVAGTIAYMAPETSLGNSVPASDVYSVGLLIYEGLTGQHPFAGLVQPIGLPDALHSQWLYEEKKRYPAPSASLLNNTVMPELDAIVSRCLEFEPGNRFTDAAELLDELEKLGKDTVPQGPAEQALHDSSELRAAGEVSQALRTLENALPRASKEERFALLREKGELLGLMGEHTEAAGALVQAWQLTATAAILRTVHDRAELLAQIVERYRKAGNSFQVRRYETLRANELGGGR